MGHIGAHTHWLVVLFVRFSLLNLWRWPAWIRKFPCCTRTASGCIQDSEWSVPQCKCTSSVSSEVGLICSLDLWLSNHFGYQPLLLSMCWKPRTPLRCTRRLCAFTVLEVSFFANMVSGCLRVNFEVAWSSWRPLIIPSGPLVGILFALTILGLSAHVYWTTICHPSRRKSDYDRDVRVIQWHCVKYWNNFASRPSTWQWKVCWGS